MSTDPYEAEAKGLELECKKAINRYIKAWLEMQEAGEALQAIAKPKGMGAPAIDLNLAEQALSELRHAYDIDCQAGNESLVRQGHALTRLLNQMVQMRPRCIVGEEPPPVMALMPVKLQ